MQRVILNIVRHHVSIENMSTFVGISHSLLLNLLLSNYRLSQLTLLLLLGRLPLVEILLLHLFGLDIPLNRLGIVLLRPLHLLIIELVLDAFIAAHVVVEVQSQREGHPIAYFDAHECIVIQSEPVQREGDYLRALAEFEAFLRIDFLLAFVTVILIISSQLVWLQVILNCHFEAGVEHSCPEFVLDGQ